MWKIAINREQYDRIVIPGGKWKTGEIGRLGKYVWVWIVYIYPCREAALQQACRKYTAGDDDSYIHVYMRVFLTHHSGWSGFNPLENGNGTHWYVWLKGRYRNIYTDFTEVWIYLIFLSKYSDQCKVTFLQQLWVLFKVQIYHAVSTWLIPY